MRLLYHNAFIDDAGNVAVRTAPYGWNDTVAAKLEFPGDVTKRATPDAIDIGPSANVATMPGHGRSKTRAAPPFAAIGTPS